MLLGKNETGWTFTLCFAGDNLGALVEVGSVKALKDEDTQVGKRKA